jgi:dynein light chain Tctex-type 1
VQQALQNIFIIMQSELEKDAIDKVVSEKIDKFLADEKTFRNDRVKRWCDGINRECLRDLAKLQKPYKFVVSCAINQRCGNALFQHAACFIDPTKDIVTTVHWKNDLLHCIVTVYAVPLM